MAERGYYGPSRQERSRERARSRDTVVAAATAVGRRRLDRQLWVHGTVWQAKRSHHRVPVDILVDTGRLHVGCSLVFVTQMEWCSR